MKKMNTFPATQFEIKRNQIMQSLKPYSREQIKLHGIRVFILENGSYDSFPAGHPVPEGAELAYDPNL